MTFRKFWMAGHVAHLWQALKNNYVHVCTALRVHSSGWGEVETQSLNFPYLLFITEDKCRAICLS